MAPGCEVMQHDISNQRKKEGTYIDMKYATNTSRLVGFRYSIFP